MMKRFFAFLAALALLCSAAFAGEESDLMIEEIVEDVLLDEEGDEVPLPAATAAPMDPDVFTPSSGSAYAPRPGETATGPFPWTSPMRRPSGRC